MGERSRQRVGVVMTMVGGQDVHAAAHLPGTDSAAVVVRIGRALIYLRDAATVTQLATAWSDLDPAARRWLPREFTPALVAPIAGMTEPGVVVNASNRPPFVASVEHPRGQFSYLRLQFARLVFEVRDYAAFASAAGAFRAAWDQSGVVFPDSHAPIPERTVLGDASRLFPRPAHSGRGRRHAPREQRPSAAAPATGPRSAERGAAR